MRRKVKVVQNLLEFIIILIINGHCQIVQPKQLHPGIKTVPTVPNTLPPRDILVLLDINLVNFQLSKRKRHGDLQSDSFKYFNLRSNCKYLISLTFFHILIIHPLINHQSSIIFCEIIELILFVIFVIPRK